MSYVLCHSCCSVYSEQVCVQPSVSSLYVQSLCLQHRILCELLFILWQVSVEDKIQRSRLWDVYLYVSKKWQPERSEIRHGPFLHLLGYKLKLWPSIPAFWDNSVRPSADPFETDCPTIWIWVMLDLGWGPESELHNATICACLSALVLYIPQHIHGDLEAAALIDLSIPCSNNIWHVSVAIGPPKGASFLSSVYWSFSLLNHQR